MSNHVHDDSQSHLNVSLFSKQGSSILLSQILLTDRDISSLQTLHDEKYLLVVKATPTNHAEGGTGTGLPPPAPLVAQTTLILVSIRNSLYMT